MRGAGRHKHHEVAPLTHLIYRLDEQVLVSDHPADTRRIPVIASDQDSRLVPRCTGGDVLSSLENEDLGLVAWQQYGGGTKLGEGDSVLAGRGNIG